VNCLHHALQELPQLKLATALISFLRLTLMATPASCSTCWNSLIVLLALRRLNLIDTAFVENALAQSLRRFDKGGEAFYDQISALHKKRARQQPRCCAVLAGTHARWRGGPALSWTAAYSHGV